MKKLIVLFLCLFTALSTMSADNDKPINFNQLPKESQQMIKKYFPKQSIALIKMESDFLDKSYEVIFTNGNKVEFDKKGIWKEIDCKYTELPTEIVPKQIISYVTNKYPKLKITKIEKESRNRYEVELANDIELKFDSDFNLIDIEN